MLDKEGITLAIGKLLCKYSNTTNIAKMENVNKEEERNVLAFIDVSKF